MSKTIKTQRKIIALLMAIVMVLLTSVTAFADSADDWEDYEYIESGKYIYMILQNGTAQIEYYTGDETSVEIPATLDGYVVTSIDFAAFADLENLASITIPDTVTGIGGYAFEGTAYYNDASNWTDGVLYIGDFLIVADPEIVFGEYTIKEGTKVIADYAFNSCIDLTGVIIPDSVVTIGISSFAWDAQLTNVKIGNGVKVICDSAFMLCESLTSITIPESVVLIEDFVFAGCDALKDIYIYNKDCYIIDNSIELEYEEDEEPINGWTIPENTVIHGYAGSTAEDYANRFDREFEVIESAKGDINGDNQITIVDAKWILKYVAGTKDLDAAQKIAADLNGDGKISTVDAKWVLQIIAGTRDAVTLEPIKK